MPYIDLRLHFSVKHDKYDGEEYIDFNAIERGRTDLTEEQVVGIQETLAQTDFGTITFPNGVAEAIGGKFVTFKRGS